MVTESSNRFGTGAINSSKSRKIWMGVKVKASKNAKEYIDRKITYNNDSSNNNYSNK